MVSISSQKFEFAEHFAELLSVIHQTLIWLGLYLGQWPTTTRRLVTGVLVKSCGFMACASFHSKRNKIYKKKPNQGSLVLVTWMGEGHWRDLQSAEGAGESVFNSTCHKFCTMVNSRK
jgi:hypothetical protein